MAVVSTAAATPRCSKRRRPEVSLPAVHGVLCASSFSYSSFEDHLRGTRLARVALRSMGLPWRVPRFVEVRDGNGLTTGCKLLGFRGPALSRGEVATLLWRCCGKLAGQRPHQLAGRAAPGGGDGQMRDLDAFRAALRERLRAVGCTQQQLARAIGLHPHVLSHKLHERDSSALSGAEVVSIVVTLAGWGGIASKADAHALLALMALPPEAIAAEAWAAKPLVLLRENVLPGIPRDEVRRTAEAALTSDAAHPLPSPTRGEGALAPPVLPVAPLALLGRGAPFCDRPTSAPSCRQGKSRESGGGLA